MKRDNKTIGMYRRHSGRYPMESEEKQEKRSKQRSGEEMRLSFKQLPKADRRPKATTSDEDTKNLRRIADALERIAEFTDLMTDLALIDLEKEQSAEEYAEEYGESLADGLAAGITESEDIPEEEE